MAAEGGALSQLPAVWEFVPEGMKKLTGTDIVFVVSMLLIAVGAGFGFFADQFSARNTEVLSVIRSQSYPAERVSTSHLVYPTGKIPRKIKSDYLRPPRIVVVVLIDGESIDIDVSPEDEEMFADGYLTVTYRRRNDGSLKILKVAD